MPLCLVLLLTIYSYERIIQRHEKDLGTAERKQSQQIYHIIALSEGGMALHDLNGAFSISLERGVVSFEDGRLVPSAREHIGRLCKILVDVDSDDFVSFVHSSTKK